MPLKQLLSIEAWTSQGLSLMVCSGVCIKMLPADLLKPVSLKLGPPFIRLICAAHPTDTQSKSGDLGNQVKTVNICHVPQTSPEPCLQCDSTHPAKKATGLRGPVLMLTCTLLELSVLDRWVSMGTDALHIHCQQNVCSFIHIRTNFKLIF